MRGTPSAFRLCFAEAELLVAGSQIGASCTNLMVENFHRFVRHEPCRGLVNSRQPLTLKGRMRFEAQNGSRDKSGRDTTCWKRPGDGKDAEPVSSRCHPDPRSDAVVRAITVLQS